MILNIKHAIGEERGNFTKKISLLMLLATI